MSLAHTTCSKCGKPLDLGLVNGACPVCLARMAFVNEPEDQEPAPLLPDLSPLDIEQTVPLGQMKDSGAVSVQLTSRPVELGDYELISEVARGGMGVVFRARQRSLNRMVAVKMILHGEFLSLSRVQRFLREAEAVAALNHPHIVTIFETGEHNGQHFYSMELVDGQDLARRLKQGKLPIRQAAALVRKVAEGVHYAHSRGVLHRDLKPSNIIIDQAGEPKVTDFGLAKRMDAAAGDCTLPGEAIGSPSYMAPEQVPGHPGDVTVRTDVYALGAVLYTAVTGQPPFTGESLQSVLTAVAREEPRSPRLLNPDVPADLETIILKCLQKSPAARYESAFQLAEDIGRFLRNEPIQARPISTAEKVWRWCQRKPGLAGALAGLVVLGAVSFAAVVGQWRRAESKRQEAEQSSFNALSAQARAARLSGRTGQRFASLEALQKAARISPKQELRDEAIASLALADLRMKARWQLSTFEGSKWVLDSQGFRMAAILDSQRVQIRGLGTGSLCAEFKVPDARLFEVHFLSHSNFVSTLSAGDVLRVWDLRSGKEVFLRDKVASARAVSVNADGETFAVGRADGNVELVSLRSGQIAAGQPWTRPASVLEFQPNSGRFAVASSASLNVQIVDLGSTNAPVSLPHRAVVKQLLWSEDGRVLVTVTSTGEVSIWDMERPVPVLIDANEAQAEHVVFDYSGKTLITSSAVHGLRLWNWRAGELLLRADELPAGQVARRPDGSLICLLANEIQQVELVLPTALELIPYDPLAFSRVSSGSVSPDGRYLALATENGVHLRNMNGGEKLAALPLGRTDSVAFDSSGALISGGIFGLQRVPVERVPILDHVALLIGPVRILEIGAGPSPFSSPSKSGLFATAEGSNVLLLGADGNVTNTWLASGAVSQVALSPDERWLATIEHDKPKVREVGNFKPVFEAGERAARVLFSHDSSMLAVLTEEVCSVLRTDDWREVLRIPMERNGRSSAIAFSPDDTALAVSDAPERISVIQLQTGNVLARFPLGDRERLSSLQFTRDGTRLVSVSPVSAARVFHLSEIRAELARIGLDWPAKPLPRLGLQVDSAARETPIVNVDTLIEAQRHIAQVRHWRDLIKNDPENAQLWTRLTRALELLGDDRGVVSSGLHASSIQWMPEATRSVASAKYRLGELAFAEHERLLNEPDYRRASLKDLAHILLIAPHRDPARARELGNEALTLDANDLDARNRVIRAAFQMGDYNEVMAAAPQMCPSDHKMLSCIVVAMAMVRRGDVAGGEALLNSAVRANLPRMNVHTFRRFMVPLVADAVAELSQSKTSR